MGELKLFFLPPVHYHWTRGRIIWKNLLPVQILQGFSVDQVSVISFVPACCPFPAPQFGFKFKIGSRDDQQP